MAIVNLRIRIEVRPFESNYGTLYGDIKEIVLNKELLIKLDEPTFLSLTKTYSSFMKSTKKFGNGSLSLTQSQVTIIAFLILTLLLNTRLMAQDRNQMVRLAKIKVDSLQLEKYNAALKEQMTTAIRVEPSVLTYYAVADKSDPTNITIFEIYADTAAYNLHVGTAHFKKYKETVKDMVKSLELVDVRLIGVAKKPNM